MDNVILYSTPTCPNCAVLRKKMTSKNIPFVDNQSTEEMEALNITRVPALKVGDEIMDFGKANKWINEQ